MEKIPELRNVKRTSLRPTDIYRCLQLKVWDAELQKMTGVPEMALSLNPATDP